MEWCGCITLSSARSPRSRSALLRSRGDLPAGPRAEYQTMKSDNLILFAPLIFVSHFLEESSRFVIWFNSHVDRGISPGLFWRVNITALVITLIVVAFEWFSRSASSLTLAVAWL